MNQSPSIKWLINIGIILAGLCIGYFIQPTSLNKYIGNISTGTIQILADGQHIEYVDVNNDGSSEEFIYYHLSDNRQPVINQYSNKGVFQNVWYLDGEVAENFDFISGDYNNDSINEVFIFSYFQNCLCLYGLVPGNSNKFLPKKLPVYQFANNIDFSHIVIHSGGIADLNGDGFGEVVFSINSRFTPNPRRVFAYDIHNDSLFMSPELGLQLVGRPILYDIDKSKTPEIFLSTLNSTNQAWISQHNQAQYSASIILQSDLNYYMVPALYESRLSVTSTFPITTAEQSLIGTISWPLREEGKARIMVMNQNGEIVQQKRLSTANYVFDPKRDDWSKILLFDKLGIVSQFGTDLALQKNLSLKGSVNQIEYLDVDSDNFQELIVVQNNKLKIYRNNLTNPVVFDIPGLNVQKVFFSVKKDLENGNMLSIQNNNQQYLISYSKNKFFWVRYTLYLVSILILYFIFFILSKIHFRTIDRVKNDNEKFYIMQMDLIRNQLDPHFLFNALNSISFSINKDERKTAYYNLGLFSKFLRESIITLDDFSRSLEEELEYVKNYLMLEKFRFKEKFDYDFIIGPGVNKSQKVPKLILFSFIESALKKSILPKNTGGRIEVTVDTLNGKGIYIMISDSGLHRDMEGSAESHTKNMLMMNRIVAYFNQFNIKKIEMKYKDIGTAEKPKGSTVEIAIPPDYKYII